MEARGCTRAEPPRPSSLALARPDGPSSWALPLSDADSDPGLCEHLPDPGPGLATPAWPDSAREPRARAGGAMTGWAQVRTVGAASPRRQGSAPGGPPSSESRLKVGTWVVLGSDSERPRDHPDQARLPREWPAPVQCCVTAGTAVLGGLPSWLRLSVRCRQCPTRSLC